MVKDVLHITDFSANEILETLALAQSIKEKFNATMTDHQYPTLTNFLSQIKL